MDIKQKNLSGVYTAMITPMDKNQDIDWNKFEQLIDEQINAGVSGIVLAGTTGQSATLTYDEQICLGKWMSDYIDERVDVIFGAGSNSTHEAIMLSKRLENAIEKPITTLHVTGYYNKPPQEGLIKHFETIAKESSGNIILYNVPGRTHSNLEIETLKELAKIDNIIGIKDATGDISRVKKIKELGLNYLSGEDDIFAQTVNEGGDGIISASANVAPKRFVDIYQQTSPQKRVKLQNELNPLVNLMFSQTNPIPVSYVLGSSLRNPLLDLESYNKDQAKTIDQFFENINKTIDLGINIEKYR